jgi:peptidyl-prolyl cis-trans isomerase D
MLQAIRDRITGIVAIFVLGLLAVPFLFFGVESYIRTVPQDAVAVVGDDEISSAQFQTSFANYRAELRRQQGDAYDEIATNQPLVRREHLEGMIDQLLLRQHAAELGLTVTEGALLRIISDIPAFQVDGRFDRELYTQLLRGTGRTPRSFERELRDDMMVSMVPQALSASAVITEAEIDQLLSMQQEARRVSFIEVASEAFLEQVNVTDADVEAFYRDNLDSYMTEEQVRIAYVELDAADLTDGLALSEAELRNRYEAAQERYLLPEARSASHILIETGGERDAQQARELADELRLRILEGEDFAELAASYSDDPGSAAEGGELGWIEPGEMVTPFEDALYALGEAGDISDPVETTFGFHLIRLDDIRPPQGMSFEEAREEILAEHIERESEAIFIELSERMVDLVFADDSTLEPLARELGLEIRTSDVFSRTGGTGIAANRRVVDEAFSDLVLREGSVSDPIDLDRNHLVAIKLDEHFPAEPMPLADVADSIRERLEREQASDLARERAEQLLAEAEASELELVAASAELELTQLEQLGRFDFQHGPDFVSALFRLAAPGESASLHVLPKGRNFALVRLESVSAGNPAEASEIERMMARQQLRFARMDAEVAGLVEYLRTTTEIRVIEDRL